MSVLLRDAMPTPDANGVQKAIVTSVSADGTAAIDLPGVGSVDSCAVLDTTSSPPLPGDTVQVMRTGPMSWLVLGKIRTFNPPAARITASLSFPFNVTPAASGAANPLVVPANNIRSYRSNEGWSGATESNRAAQGAYSTRWGYYRGCYFYGSGAFSSIAGHTCTSFKIRLSRLSSGGIAGGENQWLALHAHPTIPSTAPLFTVGAVNVGTLAWGASAVFTLPTWWGQRLIDVGGGVGHLYSGTSDYSICKSLSEDSLSGRLEFGWS